MHAHYPLNTGMSETFHAAKTWSNGVSCSSILVRTVSGNASWRAPVAWSNLWRSSCPRSLSQSQFWAPGSNILCGYRHFSTSVPSKRWHIFRWDLFHIYTYLKVIISSFHLYPWTLTDFHITIFYYVFISYRTLIWLLVNLLLFNIHVFVYMYSFLTCANVHADVYRLTSASSSSFTSRFLE